MKESQRSGFPSWNITLDVGDVTVAAVHLHPLLHGPSHNFLRQPLSVFQEHRVHLGGPVGLQQAELRSRQTGKVRESGPERITAEAQRRSG
ncbi:hypothetical protein GOODEAATRI_021677 [Goodea atripinnis]|uniref:Uncharacterized protein n=1 Tax=Goodea atripinnis TaxID=208336 RepID=A0ABV0PFX8_9TELE